MVMNQIYFRSLSALLSLIMLLSAGSTLAKKEYVKTYEETYSIAEQGKIDLENRYGKIKVRTWAKNEVNIKVAIIVNASSDSKAESTFDRIKINFSNSNNLVSAKTIIDAKKSFWNFLQQWWGDADLSINYEVYMPESADLEVENRYGDLEIASISGNMTVDVKYGNFTLDHASEDLLVNLAYGNGVVAKTNRASINLSYGKIRINDVNTVDIDSRFSKIIIESANKVTSESRYDGYTLGDVGTFTNNGKYDNVKIEKLEELTIETKYTKVEVNELLISAFARHSYGGLSIDNVASSVKDIDAKGKYTGFEIDLTGLPEFRIQADTRYTKLHDPGDLTYTKEIRDDNEHYIEGYKGDPNSDVIIKISAEYGGLRLR